MTYLTEITTPFGLLDVKTQQALRESAAAGDKIEAFAISSGDKAAWVECTAGPSFHGWKAYRVKPRPLELWVNQYDWGFGELYPTKAQAEKEPRRDRIRCIRLIAAPDQSEGADLNERQLDAVQQDITMGR
jgi:hypothetical protein